MANSEYAGYDVPQLWEMVDGAKQGLEPTRKQVDASRRAVDLLDAHGRALRGLRGQLAERWPPEKNAASAAYLAELDRLIDAVTQTATSVASGASMLGAVAESIDQAHAAIKPVHEEYVRNAGKLAAHESAINRWPAGCPSPWGRLPEWPQARRWTCSRNLRCRTDGRTSCVGRRWRRWRR